MRYLSFITKVFFLSCLLVADGYAQKSACVAEFICEYAKNLYDRGILEEAAHEFSKALVIDPDNDVAKFYLKKMGFEAGKYAVERPDLAVSELLIVNRPAMDSSQLYPLPVSSFFGADDLAALYAELARLKNQIRLLRETVQSKTGEAEPVVSSRKI